LPSGVVPPEVSSAPQANVSSPGAKPPETTLPGSNKGRSQTNTLNKNLPTKLSPGINNLKNPSLACHYGNYRQQRLSDPKVLSFASQGITGTASYAMGGSFDLKNVTIAQNLGNIYTADGDYHATLLLANSEIGFGLGVSLYNGYGNIKNLDPLTDPAVALVESTNIGGGGGAGPFTFGSSSGTFNDSTTITEMTSGFTFGVKSKWMPDIPSVNSGGGVIISSDNLTAADSARFIEGNPQFAPSL